MRFPDDQLSGFTTDFGGAYRQVPSGPNQSHLFGITMWDAVQMQVVVGLAVAQIFGSRSAPELLQVPRLVQTRVHDTLLMRL